MRVLFLALVLALAALVQPAAACQVEALATVPLLGRGGTIAVTVQVNGADAVLKLDTGASRSILTPAAVRRLNVTRDEWAATTMGGIGGVDRRPNANPKTLGLAGIPLTRRTAAHDHSLAVADIPGAGFLDGLLGRDFLSLFDLDLNMPARTLTLYRVTACSGRFLPWTGAYRDVPVTVPAGEAFIVQAVLDGKPLRALLDTGADASLLAAPGMYKMGLGQGAVMADRTGTIGGIGPRRIVSHRHVFQSLTVGGITIATPEMWVEPVRLNPIADMLLGGDWLAGRRVWLSYSARQFFLLD
jgi:hypothetical protein